MSRTSSAMHGALEKNKFKGVRRRKWGKWVSEIRVPGTRERLWLGTYATPEAAAVAHDVAVYSLRKPSSLDKLKLNFPETLSSYSLQLRHDMSPRSVQKVASDVAMDVDARNIVAAKTCTSMVGTETHQNDNSNNNVVGEAQSGDIDAHVFWWGDEDDDGDGSWHGSAEDSTESEALTISIEDYL